MPLPTSFRRIIVGKLTIRNIDNAPDTAQNFVIGDLIDALEDRINRHNFYRSYINESRLMWCSQSERMDQYFCLMLEVGNKDVTGVSFLDFDTKSTRDINKYDNEGSHYDSHILIKRESDEYDRHLILIESVPGVSLSSVRDHLTWVFRSPRYERVADDVRYRPIFAIDGHQSKTIRDALQRGTLQDIELIAPRANNVDGLDEDPIIEQVTNEFRLTVNRRLSQHAAQQFFSRLYRWAINRPDVAAQAFVRIKGENGQVKRTEIDPNRDDILEQMFVQNEVVSGFDPPLEQRHNTIRQDMVDRMAEIAMMVGG